eukprot:gene2658-1656_t
MRLFGVDFSFCKNRLHVLKNIIIRNLLITFWLLPFYLPLFA